MSKTAIIAAARKAEREREALISEGVRGVRGMERRAMIAAQRAYKAGKSADGVVAAAWGELEAMAPIVADAMLAGHLRARLTAFERAAQVVGRKAVGLATPYDGALKFLEARLELSNKDVSKLAKKYGRDATTATGKIRGTLEEKVGKAMAEATRRQVTTREGTAMIRDAFKAAGVTPANSYTAENIFRTQTQLAYSAGRWQANQDPAIDEALWGYEYVTTGDDRVREEHEKLDGIRRRKNDPFWKRYMPPNGWGCRCSVIEIFRGDDEARSTPIPKDLPKPPKGFGINPGEVFRDMLKAGGKDGRE